MAFEPWPSDSSDKPIRHCKCRVCTCGDKDVCKDSGLNGRCTCCVDSMNVHITDDEPTLPKGYGKAKSKEQQGLVARCTKDKVVFGSLVCTILFVVVVGALHGIKVIDWHITAWMVITTTVWWGMIFFVGIMTMRMVANEAKHHRHLKGLEAMVIVAIALAMILFLSVSLRYFVGEINNRSEFHYEWHVCREEPSRQHGVTACFNDQPLPQEIPIRDALNVLWIVGGWVEGGLVGLVVVYMFWLGRNNKI